METNSKTQKEKKEEKVKITRRQLRKVILEAFKDLSSLMSNSPVSDERRSSRRRIVRPAGKRKPAIRGYVRDIGDEGSRGTRGKPAVVNGFEDARFNDRKAKLLTKDSPFVAGSDDYHATYEHTYTEDDLALFIKKLDPTTGRQKFMRIIGDYPDHAEGTYVIIPSLFNQGLLGVGEIMSSSNLAGRTVNGEEVKIPVVVIRTISSGRMISNVGKAFVKKVAGSRSLHRAQEVENRFRPKIKAYRE